jgi:Tfp pilus assembly protein PilX
MTASTRPRPAPRDAGSAMVLTLMVMALTTALATTVAVVTINNLQSSWRAQQSAAALNSADAGIAQAMSYLRNSGVRGLRCSPSCTSNKWGNKGSPARVSAPGGTGQSYDVWIETVTPYPENDPGTYRIHSAGVAAGSASRPVTADVQVSTSEVPQGIFARTINGGGDASVARESIFSTGCVYNRSKIQMVEGEIDLAYGIPIAVHSSQVITDSNGTGQYCPTTNKPIHRTGNQNQTNLPCNATYPYDQDRLGGSLAGTGCESAQTSYPDFYGSQDLNGDGETDVHGSFIKDDATLFKLFGIRSPALDRAQLDLMRTIAQSQGNYWNYSQSTKWSSPDEANAVMFFDLTETDPGGTVDLNNVTGFSRADNMSATDPACDSRSLIIVIEGGNVKLNSNQQLFASLFLTSSAPHGQVFKANGTSNFIGTIYADTVNLTGTANLSMDGCFLENVSPSLLDLRADGYREHDRGLD